RPKFAAFAGAFPGKTNFTDVDGIIQLGGRVLLLECKARPGALPDGQRILVERLSRLGCTVVIIAGDMRTMTPCDSGGW
ncbi:MAG TPA: hypothetical protein VHN13_11070, partial [Candidatus Tectomicrobia bacterium]|nr:hypothetical protein [Candidatus Tectomicrobia bacterium]